MIFKYTIKSRQVLKWIGSRVRQVEIIFFLYNNVLFGVPNFTEIFLIVVIIIYRFETNGTTKHSVTHPSPAVGMGEVYIEDNGSIMKKML